MVDFYGFHVGKYTTPMDPQGIFHNQKMTQQKSLPFPMWFKPPGPVTSIPKGRRSRMT